MGARRAGRLRNEPFETADDRELQTVDSRRQVAEGRRQRASIERASLIVRIGSSLHRSVERREHPFDFPELFLKSSNLVLIKDMKRASALELIVYFVCRSEGNLEVSRELPLTPLARTLRDVVGDRIDCSEELGTKPGGGASDRPPEGRTVARDGQVVSFLPDFDSTEGVHAAKLGCLRPRAAS